MSVNSYQSPSNLAAQLQTRAKLSPGSWWRRLNTLGAGILASSAHFVSLLVLFVTLFLVETDRIENRIESPTQFEVVCAAVVTVLASPGILILRLALGRAPIFELAVMIANSCLWGFGAVAAYQRIRCRASPPATLHGDDGYRVILNPEP